MTPNATWVRRAPAVLLLVGIADFVKNAFKLYAICKGYDGAQASLMMEASKLELQGTILSQAVNVVIYPATWFAYAAFAVILLGIFDQLQVRNA